MKDTDRDIFHQKLIERIGIEEYPVLVKDTDLDIVHHKLIERMGIEKFPCTMAKIIMINQFLRLQV